MNSNNSSGSNVVTAPSQTRDFPGSAGESYRNALGRVQQSEQQGTIVSGIDPDWVTVYSFLTKDAQTAPEASAHRCLNALAVLKPGTANYDSVWNLFHDDVGTLERSGKTQEAVTLLGQAVTKRSGQGEEPGKHAPNEGPSVSVNRQFGAQTKKDAEKDKAPPADDHQVTAKPRPPAVSDNWNDHNMEAYLKQVNILGKKDLAGATSSLAGVVADPAIRGSKWEDHLWSAFNDNIGKLSNPAAENKQQNIKAADAALLTAWKALPTEDTTHRQMLKNMAIQNGLVLGTSRSDMESAEATPSTIERYPVIDTGGAITPGLATPAQERVYSLRR